LESLLSNVLVNFIVESKVSQIILSLDIDNTVSLSFCLNTLDFISKVQEAIGRNSDVQKYGLRMTNL